jgi:hypothetical protein
MAEKKKTHWKKAFDSDYLSSADVDEKDLILTIQNVKLEEVKGNDGQSKPRNIAHFKEPNIKPMILNVGNSKIVKKFAGSRYIEDWNNIPIQVYVDEKVRAFGEITEGLRIRPQQPKIGKPELLPETEQWSKAIEYLKKGGKIENITGKYTLTSENLKSLKEQSEKKDEESQTLQS